MKTKIIYASQEISIPFRFVFLLAFLLGLLLVGFTTFLINISDQNFSTSQIRILQICSFMVMLALVINFMYSNRKYFYLRLTPSKKYFIQKVGNVYRIICRKWGLQYQAYELEELKKIIQVCYDTKEEAIVAYHTAYKQYKEDRKFTRNQGMVYKGNHADKEPSYKSEKENEEELFYIDALQQDSYYKYMLLELYKIGKKRGVSLFNIFKEAFDIYHTIISVDDRFHPKPTSIRIMSDNKEVDRITITRFKKEDEE